MTTHAAAQRLQPVLGRFTPILAKRRARGLWSRGAHSDGCRSADFSPGEDLGAENLKGPVASPAMPTPLSDNFETLVANRTCHAPASEE